MRKIGALLVIACCLAGCNSSGIYVIHGSNEDHRSPMEKAAQAGDAAEVKRLLAEGGDPNEQSGNFGSPLNSAVFRSGNIEVVRMLLAAGARPNGRDDEGNRCWTAPLWGAASAGDLEITRALLDAGAAFRRSSRCEPPAIVYFKPEVIDMLAHRGLDLLELDAKGRNQLHLAFVPPTVPGLESVQYLVRAGVPLNARDAAGKTPLAYWREPRDYETHWFSYWLIDRLSGESNAATQRERKAGISSFLAASGATL